MEQLIVYQSPYNKCRIGPKEDGGYVICEMEGDYDAFLSGGIANDIRFEMALLDKYPDLYCLAFDGTINNLPTYNPRIIFYKKNLGAQETDNMTNLSKFLRGKNDVFLKMDIEGHEFRIIPSLIYSGDIQKVKQLVLEIHTPADIHLFPDYFRGLSDITQQTMDIMLEGINKTHRLVHLHGNNGCKIHERDGQLVPNVFECTFIRKSDLPDDFAWERNRDAIPSKLDYPNVPFKPELQLKGYPWTV